MSRSKRRGRMGWTDQPTSDAGYPARPPASGEAVTRKPPPPRREYPWQDDPGYGPTQRVHPTQLPPLQPPALGLAPPTRRLRPSAQPAAGPDEGLPPPRKLTVTRVTIWRIRQFGRRGVQAFRRAVQADGAHQSGLTALTYAVMLNYAADAAVAVALANTLFFSAATGESKTKVALYLLITVAPFAIIAPVIGPALDRLRRGRRLALAASSVARAVLAGLMALHFNDWMLYPAALGNMVLSQSFKVLKAAVTPRVLPPGITLVKTNSRLTVFGLAASTVFGAVAAGFAKLFNSPGALWFTAVICLAGASLCLRIPAWVEATEGEVPASLSARPHKPKRQPMGRHIVVALSGNATIRVLTGFLTLFAAFVIKETTVHSPARQLLLLGVIGLSAGVGNFLGNAVGARQHFGRPHRVVLGCLGAALLATVCAAVLPGIPATAVLALVSATASALAKVSLDAVMQRDMPEQSRASAFGRSETILQFGWVLGGALGVLLPARFWLGFTVLSVLLAVGLAQAVLLDRSTSLMPWFGRHRPPRSGAEGVDTPQGNRGKPATRPLPTDRFNNPLPRRPRA